MIHVYNGSKWSEKKFDSLQQLLNKLDVDRVIDEDDFVMMFDRGDNLFVFTQKEAPDTYAEDEVLNNELFWSKDQKAAEDRYWIMIEEI